MKMVLDVNLPLVTDTGIERATANLVSAVEKLVGGLDKPAVFIGLGLLGGYLLYKIVREVRADNNVKHEVVHRGEPRGGRE